MCWLRREGQRRRLRKGCGRGGGKEVWETANTSLHVPEEEGEMKFAIVMRLEGERAMEMLEWIQRGVEKVLGAWDEHIREF